MSFLGKHHSKTSKQKMREKRKGKPSNAKGKHWSMSKENKDKISERERGNRNPFYGKHHSEKSKDRMREKLKGRKFSIDHKRKLGEAQRGEKSHFWEGGISFKPYSMDWTETLKRSIRERDHYTCQLCGALQGNKAFDIHHIDYDKLDCSPVNLITLCHSCHAKTNSNKKYWENYFKQRFSS